MAGIAGVVVPVVLFTGVVVLLAALVLAVRARLEETVPVQLMLNDRNALTVTTGSTLLAALAAHGVLLPSACGGRGTCGQCLVVVPRGGGTPVPTEATHITRAGFARGERLACMVRVREDLDVRVPADMLDARAWQCTVHGSRHLSPWLREIELELPAGESNRFQAGDYVLVQAPAGPVSLTGITVDEAFRDVWASRQPPRTAVDITEPTRRAYSLANAPDGSRLLRLVVRIALPPPNAPDDTPPGRVSTWLFSRAPGDTVEVSGFFGEFNATDSGREMVLIGGGAGIAPLRSMVLDQIVNKATTVPLSLWYGAQNERELCYADEFRALAEAHDNFTYHVALSGPGIGDDWTGARGLIHHVVYTEYLSQHAAPEEAEYYLCGPPLMSAAVVAMLEDLGVAGESVFYDDFGGAPPVAQ